MKSRKLQSIEVQAKQHFETCLLHFYPLSKDGIQRILNISQLVSYKKNQKIKGETDEADSYYFVFSGVVKIYYYKNDRLIVERFEKENGLFGGNFTTLFKHDEHYLYEAVEDCIVLKINYTDLLKLCKQHHEIESAYRSMMESFISVYLKRLTSFKSLTAEERYSEFIELNGELINRVSLKDVANYLDMTPETISRVRAKYDKYHSKKII